MSILFKFLTNNHVNHLKNINKLKTLIFRDKTYSFQLINNNTKSLKRFSTEAPQESIANILNKKLAENKTANILVYTCKPTGSVLLNSVGVFVCFLLLGAGYNTFLLFDSVRFKSRKLEDDDSFMSKAIRMVASERFKYSLCIVISILGNI